MSTDKEEDDRAAVIIVSPKKSICDWTVVFHTPSFWAAMSPSALRNLMAVQRGRCVQGEPIPLVSAVQQIFARHSLSCAEAACTFSLARSTFLRLTEGVGRLPVARAVEAVLARAGGLRKLRWLYKRRQQRADARVAVRTHVRRMLTFNEQIITKTAIQQHHHHHPQETLSAAVGS